MMRASRQLICIAVLLFPFTLAAQRPGKLVITKLTGDFYIYNTWQEFNGTMFPSNSMYLVTKDGVVLFDTPWDNAMFQPLLDSIEARHGKKAVMSISTHFHADRTAGVDYFAGKGIRTYSSKKTKDLCKQHGEPVPRYHFTRDTSFSIGGYRFRTYYPGHGHAPDNIVIWFPEQEILYGGCFVKSTENSDLGNLSDADPKAWEISMERTIRKFPRPRFVIPGHFSWQDPHSLQHTLRLLRQHNKN